MQKDSQSREEIKTALMEHPLLKMGENMAQNANHQYPVFDHNGAVGELMWGYTKDNTKAALGNFHDIAKPGTAVEYLDLESGKIYRHFPNHAECGADLILEMDSGLFEQFDLDQGYIANAIYLHSIPMRQIKGFGLHKLIPENYDFLGKAITDCLENAKVPVKGKTVPVEDMITLFLADTIGKGNFELNRNVIEFATYLYKSEVDSSREAFAFPEANSVF